MSKTRFYVASVSYVCGEKIPLAPDAIHHAMRVLRLREGDEVEIFDGEGVSATGTIHFGKDKAEVHLVTVNHPQEEHLRIILFQALVSNEKMDWIVEKACELGVSELLVFPPERTDIRVDKDKLNKRLERWKRIVVAACAQCGRNKLLEIAYCQTYLEALQNAQGLKILLHPTNDKNSPILPKDPKAVSFLIGPEGGFTQKEIASAQEMGFEAMKLGNLTLRTETAGIVAATFAQTLWGDFNPY